MSIIHGLTDNEILELKGLSKQEYQNILRVFGLNEKNLEKDFKKAMRFIKKDAQRCVLEDDDYVILVTGNTGTGKSTLCMIAGYDWDPAFKPDTHVSFKTEDRFNKALTLYPGAVHVLEEMEIQGHRMAYRTTDGIGFKHLLQTNRKKNHVQICNLPDILDIMDYIFDKRVKIWIHIISRGVAFVMIAQKSLIFGNSFGISTKILKELGQLIQTDTDAIEFIQNYLSDLPSWGGFIGVPQYSKKFGPGEYQDYKEYIHREMDQFYLEQRDGGGEIPRLRKIICINQKALYQIDGLSPPEILLRYSEGDKPFTSLPAIYRNLAKEGINLDNSNYSKNKGEGPIIEQ